MTTYTTVADLNGTTDDAQPATHTPGPWRVDGRDIIGPDGAIIIERFTDDWGGAQGFRLADLRLMAAAPEMLDTLTDFLDLVPRMSEDDLIAPALADLCGMARAVIRRAEGRE